MAAADRLPIGGVQWTTVIDFPDVVAATLFTIGCNFRCPYCHNPELVDPARLAETLDQPTILDRLRERVGFLDGVVITGGEPTIHPHLEAFVASLKVLGYRVKIDTNGTRPDVLSGLLDGSHDECGADYIAMDIKAPLPRYRELAGLDVEIDAIEASIVRIVEAAPAYEFRTTVAPTLGREDLVQIAERLRDAGARTYYLQAFRAAETGLLDPTWQGRPALSIEEIEATWDEIGAWFDGGGVRG